MGSINASDRYWEALEQRVVDYARQHNLTYTQAEALLLELSPLSRASMGAYFERKHAASEPALPVPVAPEREPE